MTDVFVKPRPGLLLAEVPPQGTALPEALAETWIADRLVVRATPEAGIVRRMGRPVLVGESGPVIPIAAARARTTKPAKAGPTRRRRRRATRKAA